LSSCHTQSTPTLPIPTNTLAASPTPTIILTPTPTPTSTITSAPTHTPTLAPTPAGGSGKLFIEVLQKDKSSPEIGANIFLYNLSAHKSTLLFEDFSLLEKSQ
jgi:hypothetical protein